MSAAPPRGVIAFLTAQALALGVTLALLLIPANELFLDEYGSEWLSAKYIAIAVFGTAASALIARAARRTRRRRRLRHSSSSSAPSHSRSASCSSAGRLVDCSMCGR